MEQNQVSDEELLERINQVVYESKQDKRKQVAETRQEDTFGEKFHDVYETTEQGNDPNNSVQVKEFGAQKNLALENHYLSLQLQAEKKKAKELQTKFKLFENSVKYFERLNGQLETIKKAVDDDFVDTEKGEFGGQFGSDAMQKIRPKTIHTAASGVATNAQGSAGNLSENFSEPPPDGQVNKSKIVEEKEEVAFRDAEDFRLLEQGLEIVKDKNNNLEAEAEKVFITKNEKRCLEDIGNLASRTRTPLDDKHQRYFEKDRRKFANSIVMPEIQEVEKVDTVPPEIISKTKETPVNITSTELDGLRSYLLQLKELIARRETAWARTTERDYSQRVEITRFKTEVSRLRMLCEKRQRDIKERDQIIATKEDEIKELQKRVQGLRNAIVKLEKKDERLMDTIDGMTNEVLENSQIVQRSYNAMKRQSSMNRANAPSNLSIANIKNSNSIHVKPSIKSKDSIPKKTKSSLDKATMKKGKSCDVPTTDEEWKSCTKQKPSPKEKPKSHHKNEGSLHKTYDKVDERLQRVEEMLHNEVLKEAKKSNQAVRTLKNSGDVNPFVRGQVVGKNSMEFPFNSRKLTPSNSTIRQEILSASTGLTTGSTFKLRGSGFPDPKKNQPTAAVIANALLAARNANVFNY